MKKKDNKGFWDKWAKRYDRVMSGDKDTYAQILNRMKKKLNRNMIVLELACGTGILSVQLAGSDRFFKRDDKTGEAKMPFLQTAFFRAGCDKPFLCAGNL